MVSHPTHCEARSVFVKCFNVAYPSWEVGYVNRDLRESDIDYAMLKSYRGRCGPRSGGRIYFGVRRSFWEDVDRPRQISLVLHELAHVKQLDHSPAFWELVAKLFWRVSEGRGVLEDVFGDGVMQSNSEWDKVKEHLVFNPTTNMVDNRSECVAERRQKMKELLEWDGEVGRWDGVSLRTLVGHNSDSTYVKVGDLVVPDGERVSEDELFEWFSNPWGREGVSVGDRGYSYRVDPVTVRSLNGRVPDSAFEIGNGTVDGEFEVVEGGLRAQLYQAVYAGDDQSVRVIVDRE